MTEIPTTFYINGVKMNGTASVSLNNDPRTVAGYARADIPFNNWGEIELGPVTLQPRRRHLRLIEGVKD